MSIEAAPVDENIAPAWSRFVSTRDDSGALHDFGWRRVLQTAYPVAPVFIAARDLSGEVRGVVGAYAGRSFFRGRYLDTLEDGILADSDEAYAAILRSLRDAARARDARLCVRNARSADAADADFVTIHSEIALGGSCETRWAGLGKKTRWSVRQARKNGLAVECSAPHISLDLFYALYARRMRDLGTPVMPAAHFHRMAEVFGPERLKLHIVKSDGTPVGGMLCLVSGRRWTNLHAAAPPSLAGAHANALLYWEAIAEAARSDATWFNLGRSPIGSSTLAFKRKWRATERDVRNTLYAPPSGRASVSNGAGHVAGLGLYSAIWRRLPVVIANRVGPILRRQMPFG